MFKQIFITKIIILLSSISLKKTHPKADKLRKLTLSSDRGLIEFSSEMYKEYVITHPRPYDIIILFTQKKNCNLCQKVLDEFIQVSDSYRDSNGFKPDMITRKRAIFFAVLFYSKKTKPIFTSLKFTLKANILYTTPYNIQLDNRGELYIKYDEDYAISYKKNSKRVYALKMMEFANAKSQRKFYLKKNPSKFFYCFLFFLGILFFGLSIYKYFKNFLLSPILWLSGSLLIFIICIGGTFYNIIHHTPFAKYDKNWKIIEFIHPKRKSQYFGEGIFMSSLFVLEGTILYSFVWLNRIKKYIIKIILGFLSIIFFLLGIYLIFSIFKIKHHRYNPSFFPPTSYIKGSYAHEQGNSF